VNCPSCTREVVADRFFCNWCGTFMPKVGAGTRAGLVRRWFATVLDGAIGGVLYMIIFLAAAGSGSSGQGSGSVVALIGGILLLAYGVWYLVLLSKGATPGKKILGIVVVESQQGQSAGFGRMLLREIIGKWVSSLVIGLGYFWAIWDKDSQAWHDKIAGTVVVRSQ